MKRILIVEDEVFLVQVLQDNLVSAGYEIDTAQDGEIALEKLRVCCPDLMLLDLLIPKIDGFHVLETVRKDSRLKSIPVYIISNLSSDTEIKRALDLGADGYYIKSEHPVKEIVGIVIQRLEKGKIEADREPRTCPGI